MNVPSKSRQLFLRYVLDEMSPDERAKIDDALITDQEFSDSFQEARYDLIDAYAADELPADTRGRVEQAIFAIKNGAILLPVSPRRQAMLQIPRRKFRIAFLVSALSACILLAAVFIRSRQRTTPQMAQSPQSTPLMTTSRPIRGEPSSVQPSTPTVIPSRKIHLLPGPSVMAVAMPLGTARGTAGIPIHIHRGIDRIEIEWPVPPDSGKPPYTLEVTSGRSKIAVLAQHGLLAPVGNLRVAKFLLPVDKLPNGQYLFRLSAADAARGMPIAEFAVRVSR